MVNIRLGDEVIFILKRQRVKKINSGSCYFERGVGVALVGGWQGYEYMNGRH